MTWDLGPECISVVILSIVWIYSRKGNPTPNLKNRLFQASFLATFVAMSSNIVSTMLLSALTPYLLIPAWIANTVYFIFTPLMGAVYCFYTIANLFENDRRIRLYLGIAAAPGVLYGIFALMNPINPVIFNITLADGYTQGSLIALTYFIFYFYGLVGFLLALIWGKRVSTSIRLVLMIFPLVAVLVISFQMFVPNVMLTGFAATCSMLLIYLYLQNKQISIDHLTGIPNRHEFLSMLSMRLKRGTHFGILVLSLRQFKRVNDTFGQHNGDSLLAAVSAWLHRDLGFPESSLCRYSGDEFAVFVDHGGPRRTELLVTQIAERMTLPWDVGDCICMLSYGIGWIQSDVYAEPEGLINGLEYAVKLAQNNGSSRRCTPELLEKATRRQKIVDLLNTQLQEQGFEVYFQPIITVDSESPDYNQFRLAEALLRMKDESLGIVSPGEFIPIAEEACLIVDITYLVLDRVCLTLKRLIDQGLPFDGISVNFSAQQFAQTDLIERMTEIIDRHQVPYHMIKVEITEGTFTENSEAVLTYMQKLHDLGIRIALDDFGTGYSNLASVITMPIDTVKLDKSLLYSSMESERFSTVVRNLARGFRELGLRLLAEGVETPEQSAFVVDCGCCYVQGFLYAKPMPATDFEAFLHHANRVDT